MSKKAENNVYKDELCAALSEELNITKVDAEKVVNALFFKLIPGMLMADKNVCLKGFGIFVGMHQKCDVFRLYSLF